MKFCKYVLGAALILSSLLSFAQSNLTTPVSNRSSYGEGVYNALAYVYKIQVFGGGSTAGGTYAITLYSPGITLADGRRIAIFGNTTLPSITIGQGANAETVAVTSASGCTSVNTNAASQGTCQLTATFTNAHGRGDQITSGDLGFVEAVNDAKNNGGGQVFFQYDTGPITLATGATTTTYSQGVFGGAPSTGFFPSGAYILGVSGRVTTTITGSCTGWGIGDGTTALRWTANNTGLTSGTVATNTGAAWTTAIASTTTGYSMAADKSLVITCAGGNPSAGAIKVRSWGYIPVGSNF